VREDRGRPPRASPRPAHQGFRGASSLGPGPHNIPAFSCGRQSDGEAGASDLSAATPWADEIKLHRDLRLQAVSDSPDSFGETFAEAAERPATYWESLTRSVTEPRGHVMFVAFEGDNPIGCAYGLRDHERDHGGRVGGMWVHPESRRLGVGSALLLAILEWARAYGLNRLALWAPDQNRAAIALYRRAGFRETENRRSLATNESVHLVEMNVDT
jgi:GNAT superfamily N-acetyltransferase